MSASLIFIAEIAVEVYYPFGGIMMLKQLVTLAIGILLFANFVFAAPFCACCAEPGTYSIWTGKPGSYQIEVLKEMDFDKGAFLYMTEAGFESIKGLSEIETEFSDGSWVATPGGPIL